MKNESHVHSDAPSSETINPSPLAPTKTPVFSVITPVYNGEAFVDRCYRCLAMQTFTDWEWVVVDDGSTDRTAELVRRINDPRVRLTSYQPNRGRGLARTLALEESQGDWMVIWDVDDLHYPDRLARIQEARLQGYEFFCSYAVLADNDLRIKGVRGFLSPTRCLPRAFVHPTLACQMNLARSIGYTSPYIGEDALIVFTLGAKHRGCFCEEALSVYQEDREIYLQKTIDSNLGQWRTVRELCRNGTFQAGFRDRWALNLKWALKVAVLKTLRIAPQLYLYTVKRRDCGRIAGGWELSEERIRFLDQFRQPESPSQRAAA